MSKELIVSVNGREKKIAIIENERVTEFYIERGEENQGIVGNIYKGRVMRVLPGMQSAFVDIGLERDAFLYVSDFFDEEEEFERIVIDKSKKADVDEATRAAQDHIERSRLERERHMEVTQERAEPLLDAEPADAASVVLDEEVADEAPPIGAVETPVQAVEARDTEGGGRKRGRRGRRRGKSGEEYASDAPAEQGEQQQQQAASSFTVEDINTPFVADSSSFQRVVDEDESAAENGAMFKDARIQERIFDQIHAVEFDMEDVTTTEVGSLLGSEASARGSFQRVDDTDIASADEGREPAYVQETVAAHVGAFIDEIKEETAGAQTFERVSDDEGGAEEESKARRGKRTTTTATKRSAKKEAPVEEAPKAKRAGSKAATKSSAKKSTAAASKKSASKKGGGARRKAASESDEGETDIAVLESEAERAESTDLIAAEAADGEHFEAGSGDNGDYEDAEASLSSGRSRGELATRRGGRRRRRPGSKPQEANGEERTDGKDEESEVVAEVEEKVVSKPAETTPRESSRRDRPERAPQARTEHAPPSRPERPPQARPEARPERSAREDRSGGNGGGSGGRNQRERGGSGGSGGGGGRRDRHQPTITDLLREGQEVLVQIAKEPIAKKGARITSHIALPGRFLVYMPTVEHVGVSRKIESDSERARLRKLIQIIRTEEDVPSGGFIVRTAGVGISEEDLRDDARYLVRTWLDIRRSAEKMKAPAMAHRDLDLVQRLLRDQLSDEFTAIRVDSEEEYLRIVEFINRIQPRMVKRVKLYTRDAPILEAFGVQVEIDKAIKPRVWLKSGGYLVINQTEALVAIDVNTGKFVGRGGTRLEDTITRTNLEAVDEIVRQIRLRDLGGIIVLDLIDMEDRRNRNRVMQALQEALQGDKSPTKVLSFNDFGLVIMTRKRVKQSLERTLCAPCSYCQGAGLIKSPQTICYEILDEARRLGKGLSDAGVKQTTLRINPEVARALRSTERDVLTEIEDYLGAVDITSDSQIHQEQFDFAFI